MWYAGDDYAYSKHINNNLNLEVEKVENNPLTKNYLIFSNNGNIRK